MRTVSPIQEPASHVKSLVPINTDQAVSSIRMLCHQIRGRLANLIGAAKEKKNLRAETVPRLRNEIHERCSKIQEIIQVLQSDRDVFRLSIEQYIQEETLGGKRDRRVNARKILESKTGVGSIIALLEVAGVPEHDSVRFFSGSTERAIEKIRL